ncbi:MAG TPA: Gfo/Idh/MocA family oxidoreductase [Eudoraea sp.]|nr:Gfo/Idh/MocA family oxidoreductase [Eudoraea sp.]
MKDTIGWGIVGLGNIAHSFARDLKLVPDARLVAVASRSLSKAEEFGSQFGSVYHFGSYQELFDCPEVDVVYIAVPHTLHAQLTMMAIHKGKHVLCEKPMGINSAQVEKMVAAAKANKVFLMEALWSRFNPCLRKVKQLVDDGAIGALGYLQADFAFYALDRSEEGRILNPALAGGSLLDIGIYPIFLAYLMLGNPEKIKAVSRFHKTGAEIQTSMIFEYPRAHAMLYSGFTCRSEMKAEISGSHGSIYLHPRWHETQGYSIEKEGNIQQVDVPKTGKGYAHEIDEVHACLRAGNIESELWSLNNSMDLIRIMDAIRRQTGIVFPGEG